MAFVPNATSSLLGTRQLPSSSSPTVVDCALICLSSSTCYTAVFNTQTSMCIMYSEALEFSGYLSTASSNNIITVSMNNPPVLSYPINLGNSVYAVWNVSAGGDSLPSSAGVSTGQYWLYYLPQYVFDGNLSTGLCSYGRCNVSYFDNGCGQNTGVYVTAQYGAFILSGFCIATGPSSSRDPLIITIEGSNLTGSALTLGSSWTLIYNGTSGLSVDPGRSTLGIKQMITNNTLAFTSYRFLVITKRGYESSVEYNEIQLFGQ